MLVDILTTRRVLKDNADNQSGAYLVELALALPIFLAVVFILIWVGLALNARSSIISSVNSGVRLAMTRGDLALMGDEPILAEINSWDGSAANLPTLLYSPDINSQVALDQYDDWTALVFPDDIIEDLPNRYLYALAYIYEGVKLGVGPGMVRYPCDPNGDDGEDGPGCLMCRFLNGGDDTGLEVGLHISCQDGGPCEPPENQFGIECEYSSPRTIIQLVNAIIGGAGADPIIFRHKNYLF